MIRLLTWIFALSAVATLGVVATEAEPVKAHAIVSFFMLFSLVGWLVSFFVSRRAFFQVIWLVELAIYFTKELFVASIAVAREVLTKKHHMEAGIVSVPLDTQSDLELTVFSALVSLTPGTLSMDISADKKHLFVHAMYIPNADSDALVKELKNGFERRVINVFR